MTALGALHWFTQKADKRQEQETVRTYCRTLWSGYASNQEKLDELITDAAHLQVDNTIKHEAMAEAITWLRDAILDPDRGLDAVLTKLNEIEDAQAKFADMLAGHDNRLLAMEQQYRGYFAKRPKLRIEDNSKLRAEKDLNWYVYRDRRVKFVGRDDEMKRLDRFLKDDAPLLWWLALGLGGMGKSRMALELCLLAQQQGWYAGFLDKRQSMADWDEWTPDQPTLIVVDYASERAGEIGEQVDRLYRAHSHYVNNPPVRILLLERNILAEWWGKLCTSGRRDNIRVSNYEAEGTMASDPKSPTDPFAGFGLWMRLEALGDEDLLAIMSQTAGMKISGQDAIDRILDFRRLDAASRPLFAAFAGQALSEGESISDWDQGDVVQYVLDRHKEQWQRHDVDSKHLNLLALATMTGGLPYSSRAFGERAAQTCELINMSSDLVPVPKDMFAQMEEISAWLPVGQDKALDEDTFRLLCEEAMDWDYLPGLKPDILGEVFVLEHLASEDPREPVCVKIRDSAWEQGGRGFVLFLLLALADCPQHPTLARLLEPPSASCYASVLWGGLMAEVISLLNQMGLVDIGEELYARFASVPETPAILLQRAKAAFNLSNGHLRTMNVARVESLYKEIEHLATTPEIKTVQAVAAVNLFVAYGKTGDLPKAEKVYDTIKKLSLAPELRPEFELERAKGAFNLSTAYGEAGKAERAKHYIEKAEYYYDEIGGLSPSPEIQEVQAKTACNLIVFSGDLGDIASAERYYGDIKNLPVTPEIQLEQAIAAVNLVGVLARSSAIEKAEKVYGDIDRLPRTQDIERSQAMAAGNLLRAYGDTGRERQADKYWEDIERPHTSPAIEQRLREMLISIAHLRLSAGNPAGALKWLDRAEEKVDGLPSSTVKDMQLKVIEQLRDRADGS